MGILKNLAKTAMKRVALVTAVVVGKKVLTKVMSKEDPVQEAKEVEIVVEEVKAEPAPQEKSAAKPKVAAKPRSSKPKTTAKPKTAETTAAAKPKAAAKPRTAKPKAEKAPEKAVESPAEASKPETPAA